MRTGCLGRVCLLDSLHLVHEHNPLLPSPLFFYPLLLLARMLPLALLLLPLVTVARPSVGPIPLVHRAVQPDLDPWALQEALLRGVHQKYSSLLPHDDNQKRATGNVELTNLYADA